MYIETRETPDGRRYWLGVEENTRGKRRYSADAGLTWAASVRKAFAAAARRTTKAQGGDK